MVFVRGSQYSLQFVFSFSILCLPNSRPVHRRMFYTLQRIGNVFSPLFSRLASRSFTCRAHSVATLSQTQPRLCQSHMCFHPVWLYGSFFISTAFVDCHHLCFSICKHLLQGINHRVWPFMTHRKALHMLWTITSDKNGTGNPGRSRVIVCPRLIFLFFLNRNTRLIAFVSHPLILSTRLRTNIRSPSNKDCRCVPPSFCTSTFHGTFLLLYIVTSLHQHLFAFYILSSKHFVFSPGSTSHLPAS